MEQNKEYISIKSIITSLEQQLATVEHFNQEMNVGAKRREIEEHFERCIHALEVRKHELVSQLDQITKQQGICINTSSCYSFLTCYL